MSPFASATFHDFLRRGHCSRSGWETWCALVLIVTFAGCQTDLPLDDTAQSQPEGTPDCLVTFDEDAFDAGAVSGAFEHSFWFLNSSGASVELKEVRPSCICTAAAPEKRIFAPNERGHVLVRSSMKGKPPGRHEFVVNLSFDGASGVTESRQLRLVAYNQPELQQFPEVIPLRVRNGSLLVSHVRLVDYRMKPLMIHNVVPSDKRLHVSVERVELERTGERTIHLAISGADLIDNQINAAGHLELYTDDEAHRVLVWPFTMRRIDRVLYSSPAIVMRAEDDGSYRGEAIVRSLNGDPVECAGELVNTEGLDVSVHVQEEVACAVRIRVQTLDAVTASWPESVVVKVLSPIREDVVLPLLWPRAGSESLSAPWRRDARATFQE